MLFGSKIMGIYNSPHLAKSGAVEMLMRNHGLSKPPPIRVDDLKLGHFTWDITPTCYWRTESHLVDGNTDP